jgi:transcriptional regulator with XRE-family HTH domain
VRDSDAVAVMLRELGRQLAALRREAGLTQEDLAARAGFSRSAVLVAEIGRQFPAREFWAACDKALDTSGVLAAGSDQVKAVHEAEERAAARAAQQAREARALAALTAARQHDGAAATVTALQPCPHCGCQVAVLTTLIAQPAAETAAGNGSDAVPRPGTGQLTAG